MKKEYDCRTCAACCKGFQLFVCSNEYYKKYGVLYEMRGLSFIKKDGKYQCMTEPCRNLKINDGLHSCLIQATKPRACVDFKPGSKSCIEARRLKGVV
jgi:hypothetical protein